MVIDKNYKLGSSIFLVVDRVDNTLDNTIIDYFNTKQEAEQFCMVCATGKYPIYRDTTNWGIEEYTFINKSDLGRETELLIVIKNNTPIK